MELISIEINERLSRFVLKMLCFVISWFFYKFRKNSLKNYGICPTHYLSAPALHWDAMLNMKKVEVLLTSDADMYFLFEKGMRDRVCYISKRYSQANNKFLKSYDPNLSKDWSWKLWLI